MISNDNAIQTAQRSELCGLASSCLAASNDNAIQTAQRSEPGEENLHDPPMSYNAIQTAQRSEHDPRLAGHNAIQTA